MIRYRREMQALAMAYAALAGAVDAIGFIKSGGLYVSFMTGNSTRLAIGIADGGRLGLAAAALIALFVTGVVLNVIFSESVPAAATEPLAAGGVAVLLLGAVASDGLGSDLAALAFLCLAMGASNAIFRRDGEVGIGVTYMTGTLVKLGHHLSDSARGRGSRRWLPYFLLWASLVCGGIAGAVTFLWSGRVAIWAVALIAIILTFLTARFARQPAKVA